MDGAACVEIPCSVEDAVKVSPSEEESRKKEEKFEGENCMLYKIDDIPPWYLSIVLGFQQFLTMLGSALTVPFILGSQMCIPEDDPARGYLVSTMFFVSGFVTFLQSTIGVRLPIIQGGSFAFLVPIVAILNLEKWKCPDSDQIEAMNLTTAEIWQPRMREVQGAVIFAALFEIFVGISGIMGLMLRFVTPLTIAPTVTLIGLALFTLAADKAAEHWGISFMAFALIALFSQYLRNVNLPLPVYKRMKGFHLIWKPIFQLFPVLLAIILVWMLCFFLTVGGALDTDSRIRTDKNIIIQKSPFFRFPYPGQWGLPTVSAAAVLGMIPGVMASIIESIGDYYACANLSSAPPPPVHAINRGILMEGIGCIIDGMWGSGGGTTSYSQNIGAIGITKVASRRVIQYSAIIMMVLGIFGKFGSFFVTMPSPLVGGMFCAMFGMVAAVGLSALQYVDLNSPRNLFVIGSSLILGLAIPYWMNSHQDIIMISGASTLNQIIRILLTTSMFVGGFIGFLLDNTIPGTDEERGLIKWRAYTRQNIEDDTSKTETRSYDFPYIMPMLQKFPVFTYIPVCPTYKVRGGFWTMLKNKLKKKRSVKDDIELK